MSALGLLCLAATSTAAAGAAMDEQSVLAIDAYRLESLIGAIPSGGTFSSIFEMVTPPVTPLTEDAGGFGALDPERLSLLGESWTWTRWRIDGHDVTDPLFPGAAAFHLPFRWAQRLEVSMTSRPGERGPSGVAIDPRYGGSGVQAGFRAVIPELGGITPGAIALMNALSGRHSRERDVPPPSERRRYRSRVDGWATGGASLGGGHLTVAAELTDTTRRFLDFDPTTARLAGTIDAPGARATLGAGWRFEDWRVLVLFEHADRGSVGLEAGLSHAESMRLTIDALLVGVHRGPLRGSLSIHRYGLRAEDRSATREILDIDGEGTDPWQPDGDHLAVSAGLDWESGPFYASLDGRALFLAPRTTSWSTPLTFRGEPYGRIDWTSAPVRVALGEARAGHHAGTELGAGLRLEWDLYAWAALAGRIAQADLGADLAVRGRWGAFGMFALASKAPIAPPSHVALALEPSWLEGRTALIGEGLVDTWGGSRLDVASNLAPMQAYTGAIGLDWRFSPGWRLQAQGLVKKLDHTPWIDAARDADFVTEDGVSFRAPGEKRYVLGDLGSRAPIYFGGQLQLLALDAADHLLAVSFAVYNVVGRTPPGNGPLANDPGVLDRDTASPSVRAQAFASTDADRAFLTKIVAGKRLFDALWGFVTIRHRDGQPFAFPDPRTSSSGQVTILADSPRGSPLKYDRPLAGPREDFRLDLDLQLAWSADLDGSHLQLSLMVANVLDLANELVETQIAPVRIGRGALESQVPRSMILGLELALP